MHGIAGIRSFIRCVDHGIGFEAVVFSKRLLIASTAQMLLRRLRAGGTPTIAVSPERYRRMSWEARASGIMAIVRRHEGPLTPPERDSVWVCVGEIRSPGNLGTLLRSAEAVGASGLICLGGAADPFDPRAVRASMGSLFALRIARASGAELRAWADGYGVQLVGADPAGEVVYDTAVYRRPCVLVLGEERRGLTAEQRAACGSLVRIPMAAGCDSLNVGVAGSLLLYAARRQRERAERPGKG